MTDDLSAIGLVSADALRTFENVLPVEPPSDPTPSDETRPKEAQNLIRALIRSGHLTRLQASTALEGKARELVYGEYVVLDQLDNAGVTQVYKAEHRRLKRTVALRLFSRSVLNSPESVRRFHDVVQAAARLVHPNVVATQDAGEAAGVHFIVMEYVDGRNLKAVTRERGPLPYAEAVDYILQGARGLAYAHERGVVHGDVKPSNLLLNHDGTVKVLEVGLSRLDELNSDEFSYRQDSLPFTLSYLAPEQRVDPRSFDALSDIYSLGCILYSLLAGTWPLPGPTPAGTGSEPPGPSLSALRAVRGDLPHALGRVLEQMTAIRPGNRFATMKQVVAELELLAAMAAMAPQGPSTSHQVEAPCDIDALRGLTSAPPPESPTPVAALEQSKYFVAKLVGAISATIIAPVVVALILKFMEGSPPPPPPGADAKSATAVNQRPADAAKSEPIAPSQTAIPPAPHVADPVKPESPVAIAETLGADWLDVVPAIYPPLDVLKSGPRIGANRWDLQAEGLRYVSDGKAGKLLLPVEIRGPSLEFEIEFTALDTQAAFVITVPFANGCVWVNFGGDGRADLAGKLQYPLTIEKGKRTKINLRLFRDQGRDMIVARADEKEIFHWSGEGQALAHSFGPQSIPDGQATTLWCSPARVVFHSYRVRGPNGSVALTRRGSAPPIARFPFDAASAHGHQEAWACYLGEPLEFVNKIGMRFVLIPPGEFQMGLSPAEAETLATLDPDSTANIKLKEQLVPHKVVITRPFYLATTETTIEQFRKFVTVTEYKTQPEQRGAKVNWHAPGYPHKPRFPVTDVSFPDLAAMCNWLNDSERLPRAYSEKLTPLPAPGPQYRIPTEAEWEFACRAGTQTLWWFGSDPKQGNQAALVSREETPVTPSVVAGRRRANPFGLFDMHGNVWETCQDVFDASAYKSAPLEDPCGPVGSGVHVNRGGAAGVPAISSYSAMRIPNRLGPTGNLTGFRVLKEL